MKIGHGQRTTGYNSTYKKLAVQWLNEILCFVLSFVVADSLVLRNLLLRQAPNRWVQLGRLRGGDSMVVDHFISFISDHYFSRCQTIHSTQI